MQDFDSSLRHDALVAPCRRRMKDENLVALRSRFREVWARRSGTPQCSSSVRESWRSERWLSSRRRIETKRVALQDPLGLETCLSGATGPALSSNYNVRRCPEPVAGLTFVGVGIPLGSSPSALLANVHLDPFDHFVKDELGFKFFVRYADDMAFLSAGRGALEGLLKELRAFLASNSKYDDVAKMITLPRLDRTVYCYLPTGEKPPRLRQQQLQDETNSKIEPKSTITSEFGCETCRLAEAAAAISLPPETKLAESHARLCLAFP